VHVKIKTKLFFLVFWYLKMLNHAMYFKYDFLFIYEKLGHMQFKIKFYFWKKDFLLFFFKETDLLNTKKASHV
jgi:hypothetical protein